MPLGRHSKLYQAKASIFCLANPHARLVIDNSHDTLRQTLEQYIDQARKTRLSQPEATIELTYKVQQLIEESPFLPNQFLEQEIDCLLIQSTAQAQLSKHNESLESALLIQEKSQLVDFKTNPDLHVRVQHCLANCYYRLGDFPKSLTHFQIMLRQAEGSGNVNKALASQNGMGAVYATMANYDKAIQQFKYCLSDEYESILRDDARIRYNMNIALAYQDKGSSQEGLPFALLAMKLIEKHGPLENNAMISKEQLIHILSDIGRIYVDLEEHDQAEAYYKLAHPLLKQVNAKGAQAFFYIGYANAMLKVNRLKEAEEYINQGLQHVSQLGEKSVEATCYQLAAQIAHARGDVETAYQHHVMFHDLQDSWRREENAQKIRLLQISHEINSAKKEAEIYQLRTTNLEREKATLIALHNEKDELLRIVAHDLNNLLSAALATMALMQRADNVTTEQQQIRYERTQRALKSATDIVSQLTSLQKAELNTTTMFEPLSISQIITTQVAENMAWAEKKQQHLITEELASATIYGNASWVRQILSNLISNAIKYSQAGATTRISTSVNSSKKEAYITVQDEGLGMTDEDLRLAFNKYTTLSAKPTQNEPSTGLGLYICRLLANRMKGDVTAFSEGKGKGSRFVAVFPMH